MNSAFVSFDSFKHPVKNIKLFFKIIKWSVQRVKRGYSDYDVGDIDLWFMLTIPDMLFDFEKSIIGFPGILEQKYYEEHKEEIRLSYEDYMSRKPSPAGNALYERMENDCRQKWKAIIGEMRRLFLESDEDTCSKTNPYSPYAEKEDYWRTDDEIYEYRNGCRKKAFALFCEWFEYLWL